MPTTESVREVDPGPRPRGERVRCRFCGHVWVSRARRFPRCPACNPHLGRFADDPDAARAAGTAGARARAGQADRLRVDPPPRRAPAPEPAPAPQEPPRPRRLSEVTLADMIRGAARRRAG